MADHTIELFERYQPEEVVMCSNTSLRDDGDLQWPSVPARTAGSQFDLAADLEHLSGRDSIESGRPSGVPRHE